jgi:hypothetical protein
MKKALLYLLIFCSLSAAAQEAFNVIGFYTAQNDQAHISFVREANQWFSQTGREHNFKYDSTSNWDNLNSTFLQDYQVVLFLDARPESQGQRKAFKDYMEGGGGWIGFHFSGFALTPSAYPQNWDWYHNIFLGSGEYAGNTWRPTSAIVRVEDPQHTIMQSLPHTFRSSPNEWYRWSNDLRKNQDIKILLAIDSSSFPLGTGPKKHEIWHSGYYPVVWTNTKYRMIYVNMGHNDIDYGNKTNKTLSFTFGNELQDQMILNALLWLNTKK